MNWPRVQLKQIASFGPQYGANASAAPWTGSRPRYVRITDIDPDGRLSSREIVEAATDDTSDYLLQEGDLLFARSGNTVGKTYRHAAQNGPCVFAGYLIRFRLDARHADSHFLFYFTQSPAYKAWVESKKRVAGQPNVNGTEYASLSFPLPTPREQRCIVEILEEADALRQKRIEVDAQAGRILPSLFHDLFGDPSRNPKRFQTERLRDLATKYSDGPFGSNLKSDHYVPNGVRVIRLQNIGLGEFIDDDKAFISERHFSKLSKHECLPGDVLIGTLGDPNVRACIQPDFLPVALNKADCVQFRAAPEKCTPEYACWLLNSPSTLAMASTLIAGQTRPRISMGRLADLLVPKPPMSLQRHFSALVQTYQPVLKNAQTSTRNLQTLFQALLYRAFNGDLTAKWRQAHMKELLAEMEQQARLLNRPSPERN